MLLILYFVKYKFLLGSKDIMIKNSIDYSGVLKNLKHYFINYQLIGNKIYCDNQLSTFLDYRQGDYL